MENKTGSAQIICADGDRPDRCTGIGTADGTRRYARSLRPRGAYAPAGMRALPYTPPAERIDERRCHICGCSEHRACRTSLGACHWIAWDLCSVCLIEFWWRLKGSAAIAHLIRHSSFVIRHFPAHGS
jgi:hypothetical protein